MRALLVAGVAGLVVAAIIAMIATRNLLAVAQVGDPGMRRGLLGALVILMIGAVLFFAWDSFDTRAHGYAALVMFAFLAAAVACNAFEHRGNAAMRRYLVLYAVIAGLMVGAAVLMMVVLQLEWDHRVLVLESTEIVLFATFWLVQTNEHWNETV